MKTTQKKGTAQVTLEQSRNPDKMIWDGAHIPVEQSDDWFEAHAQIWANHSGEPLHSSRGVLARWLYFFSLFLGHTEVIKSRYGKHIHA